MTFAALKDAVKALGFDCNTEPAAVLSAATNLVLRRLHRLHPPLREVAIEQRSPTASLSGEVTVGWEGFRMAAEGVQAISFEAEGHGTVEIGGRKERIAAPRYTAHRFAVSGKEGESVLSFRADAGRTLRVRRLSLFDALPPAGVATLPIVGEWVAIPLGAMLSDFYSLSHPPRDAAYGRPADYAYDGESKTLYLPPVQGNGKGGNGGEGCLSWHLTYRRYPRLATEENFLEERGLRSEVDVPEALEDALIFLVASLCYLEGDPEKAAHYRTLGEEALTLSGALLKQETIPTVRERVVRYDMPPKGRERSF